MLLQEWLKNTCNERGWSHSSSPLVWRELVDRGGKGILIGGANDFQVSVVHQIISMIFYKGLTPTPLECIRGS